MARLVRLDEAEYHALAGAVALADCEWEDDDDPKLALRRAALDDAWTKVQAQLAPARPATTPRTPGRKGVSRMTEGKTYDLPDYSYDSLVHSVALTLANTMRDSEAPTKREQAIAECVVLNLHRAGVFATKK